MMKIIRQLLSFLFKWFWTKPTSKPPPLKATDVINQYICIDYKGQWVNLRKVELPLWNRLSRFDKRAMALRFKVMERKKILKFVEIKGKMTAIFEKNYESKTDTI
jgi:hypothetical protein